MNHTEKSYLEIKVTFQHILILLAGVILIGSFLFYLGYQAGKSSDKKSFQQGPLAKGEDNSQAIEITSESDPDKIDEDQEPTISEEIKLHQQPGKKESLKTQTLKRESYFTIQVAAFENYPLAKNYSEKFSRSGYPVSISQANVGGKIWYRVRIGHYETRDAAIKEKNKLEKLENKKFNVVKTK